MSSEHTTNAKNDVGTGGGYGRLQSMLASARSAIVRRVVAQGFVKASGLILAAIAASCLFLVVRPGGWGPPVIVTALGCVALVAVIRHVLVPYLRVPSLAAYTRAIDEYLRKEGGDEGEFLNALELGSGPARAGTSQALVEALVRSRVQAATGVDLAAPGRQPLDSTWKLVPAVAGGIMLALMLLVPARFSDTVHALLDPQLPEARIVAIDSVTGDLRVERGASVTVAADVHGTDDAPTLHVRRGAGVWRAFTMQDSDAGGVRIAQASAGGAARFAFEVPAIDQETHYRVSLDDVSTREHTISVIEPLRITGFEITYRYPEYSRLVTDTVEARDGNIAALPGSRVDIVVTTNEPITGGTLAVDGGDIHGMELASDHRGAVELTVDGQGEYSIELTRDVDGDSQTERFGPYTVTPSVDREPLVALLEPSDDIDVPRDMQVGLTVHATDDYGLSSLYLHYSYEGGTPVNRRLGRFTGYPREITQTYAWNLADLNLLPGDLVTYYLVIYDNDSVTGPKRARTRTYTLRFPTMAELYAEVEEVHRVSETEVADVLERSHELKDTLEEIAREMKKFPESTWEDKKEMQSAFEKQQQLREQVSNIAETLGEALERLDNQELVNEDVLEKLTQIQDMMEQITDPELREAMKRLGESMSQLDQNEIQRAMSDLELSQEELLRNLEKTLELLKQVQLEEKFERAIQKTEELLARQEDVNDDLDDLAKEENEGEGEESERGDESTEGEDTEGDDSEGDDSESDDMASNEDSEGDDSEGGDEQSGEQNASNESQEDSDEALMQLSEEEEALIEEINELAELLEELAEELAEQQQPGSEEMQKMAEDSGPQKPLQSEMQQAMQQMSQGDSQGAKESGENAADQMRSMLANMQMQMQGMMNQQTLEAAEKLRKAAQDLLWISNNEEELLVEDQMQRHDLLAERQNRLLEGTRRVNEVVEEVSRTSSMVGTEFAGILGRPMRSMENATRSFEKGNRSAGRLHSYQALAQVNESIMKLLDQSQSMCQGASCSSAKQSMQQMMQLGQQQAQVNQGTRSMKGKRLTEGDKQRMARLAAQQRAIQKGLEEVAQTMDQRRDVLGRLGDLAGEMEELAEEMERDRVDDKIIEKQQKFLSRLLDAQRSVRKRGQGRERESRVGRQAPAPRPAALPEDMLSTRERLEADILRGRSDVYPAGYRELVERYFQALAREEVER